LPFPTFPQNFRKILPEFLSYLANTQTNKQTDTGKNITFLAEVNIQGAAEKSGPLNFFTVFSATIWDFNMKFYSFIYGNLLHLTAE